MKWLKRILKPFRVIEFETINSSSNWKFYLITGDGLNFFDKDGNQVLRIEILQIFWKPRIKVIINPYKFEEENKLCRQIKKSFKQSKNQ